MFNTTVLPMLRHALQFGAGFLVASGYLDGANAELLTGSLLGLASVGWWYATKKA